MSHCRRYSGLGNNNTIGIAKAILPTNDKNTNHFQLRRLTPHRSKRYANTPTSTKSYETEPFSLTILDIVVHGLSCFALNMDKASIEPCDLAGP